MALNRIAKEMGYESNEDFYKDYKTEADFLKFKNGGKLKKYSLGDYLDEEEIGSVVHIYKLLLSNS